ncbi:MAG: exosortase/archaeosortase family protein [Planctomycetota bacterium]
MGDQADTAAAISTTDQTATTSPWDVFRGPAIGMAIVIAMVLGLFYHFFFRQLQWAIQNQEDWGHTLAIPFIAGYFVYLQRSKLLTMGFRTAWTGLLAIIAGIGFYFICTFGPTTLHHHNLMAVGVATTLFGLTLLFCGWRAMLLLWFPLAYLCLFGQTISDRFLHLVTYRMQDITARGSEIFMSLLFFDIDRKANTLYLYSGGERIPLNIAEACSGMRMLMAFLALGVAMAFVGLKHLWQRIALVALAVPTAIFVNILRVTTLAILSKIDPGLAQGDFHTLIGMIWLIPAFFIYLGLQWVIRRLVVEDDASSSAPKPMPVRNPFDGRARIALIVTIVTFAVCAGGFAVAVNRLNVVLQKEPVPMRRAFISIPKTLGEWDAVGDDKLLGKAVVEELGTNKYLNRVYVRDGERTPVALQLHTVYYTGMIDAVPHVADRCWVAGGGLRIQHPPENLPLELDTSRWTMSEPVESELTPGRFYPRVSRFNLIERGRPEWVHLPSGDVEFRMSTYRSDEQPGMRIYGGYLFVANGGFTPSPDGVRQLAFDRTTRSAYYAKIQISWYSDEDSTEEEFLGYVADLMTELLPEFMYCLPDWPDVERQSRQESEQGTPTAGE